jgi:anti-sigma regulatory factor (Ser/Thr protein kinase)
VEKLLNQTIDPRGLGASAIPISDQSQVGEARRLAMTYALSLGFDETITGKVGIIITEAAGNLVKHARDGQIVLSPIYSGVRTGLEILALDRGPGMNDLGRYMDDGYSTAGTCGNGLGAIHRLSNDFDAHSIPGTGTAVLARVWNSPETRSALEAPLKTGGVSLSAPGEERCGDAWSVNQQPGRALVMVVDGLGHGWLAAEAADAAVRIFSENVHRRPAAILEAAHPALRSTRGAAIAVAEVDRDNRQLRYSGVGNISGVILGAGVRTNLVSHNGIVGHQARRFQEFLYTWPADGLLIMHSDGLGTQWRVEEYPGLISRDPSLVTGVLYRDFTRGRDDVTVVVAAEPYKL